jgi:TolB protein
MRRIITLILALSVLSNLVYADFNFKGDVTGDGRVDGKDALKIMMVIEGKIAQPSQDDPYWKIADVYPIPGEGGRVVGDGKVTKDDAYRILAYAVGLIPLGELTGELEEPLIVSFDPVSGPPGTKVALKGLNFVPGSKTENVVRLSGLDCPIISAFSTKLVFEIPAGAESGPFTVITSGGTVTSEGFFTVTQPVPGKLDLGEGSNLSPSDFTILSSYDEAIPDSEGNFDLAIGDDPAYIVVAAPKTGGENYYFSIYTPQRSSGEGSSGLSDGGVKIDAFTTAVSLIYMNPAVLPKDDFPKEKLLEVIRSLPETETLAGVIRKVYPSNSHPLDDPEVQNALRTTINALAGKMPEKEVLSLSSVMGSQHGGLSAEDTGGEIKRMDVQALNVSLQDKGNGKAAFSVSNKFFSPVDWVLRVVKVDPGEFPNGMEDIRDAKPDKVYRRLKTVRRGIVAAKGMFNITAFFADLAHGLVEVLSIPIGASALTSPDVDLDEGIYLMRSFSGVWQFTDVDDAELIGQLPEGGRDSTIAFSMNIAGLMADLIAAVVGPIPERLRTRVMISVGAAVGKKLMQIGLIDPKTGLLTAGAVGAGGLTLVILWDTLRDILNDAFNTIIQSISEEASELANLPWVKKFTATAKVLGKTFSVASKVLAIGRVVDRAVTMVSGYPATGILRLLGVSVPKITPLESALIVVGTPVSILEYPDEVIPEDKVSIVAENVSDKASENHVFFGGVEARITSLVVKTYDEDTGKPKKMKLFVKVPQLSPGYTSLTIMAPRGTGSVGGDSIKVKRKPFIDEITPSAGFAAVDGKFEGTKVYLKGRFFNHKFDVVYFGREDEYSQAEVDRDNSASFHLIVRVPKGVKTGKIYVKTPEGIMSESSSEFRIIDSPPQISDPSPKEARSGSVIKVSCTNLPPSQDDVQVTFTYGGKTVWSSVDFMSSDHILTHMPGEIPEGSEASITVETPAGKSNAVTVKRLKGREKGFNLDPYTWDCVPSFEIKADGKLSLGEALKIAQSRLDPFQQPFDDADMDVIIVRKDFYTMEGENKRFLKTEYSFESAVPRSDKGGPGHETAFAILKRFEIIDGRSKPLPSENFTSSMDNSPDYTDSRLMRFADKIPGLGEYEEGDYFSHKFGKDYADTIRVDLKEGVYNSDIILEAGGDTILIDGSNAVINGDIIIKTDDSAIMGSKGVVYNGKLEITGNGNLVGSTSRNYVIGAPLNVTKGVFIRGCDNQIDVNVNGGDEKIEKGIVITDGAKGNEISRMFKTKIQNCAVGMEISNGAQYNHIYGYFKVHISGCDVGLHIMDDETKHNEIDGISVDGNTGAVISDGASENHILGGSLESGKIGAVIKGGAKRNTVKWFGGGKGVLVEGNDTDDNIVGGSYWEMSGDYGDDIGVAVIGDSNGSPKGTIISDMSFAGPFGTAAILLRDLQEQENALPSVTVRDCFFLSDGSSDDTPAIILDNVKGALLERIWTGGLGTVGEKGFSISLLVKGERSTDNLIRLCNFSRATVAGIHLTDKASGNRFENIGINVLGENTIPLSWDVPDAQYGILIDGGASDNHFTRVDGLKTRSQGGARVGTFSGGLIDRCNVGVMIRGGAKNNTIDRYKFLLSIRETDIVIAGEGTANNAITGCELHSMIVKDGAADTIIGSPIAGKGNSLFGRENHTTLLIQGGTTRKTRIIGNYISGEKGGSEILLVDGARDVEIGSPEPDGGNTFALLDVTLPTAICINNSQHVKIRNNRIYTWGATRFKENGILVVGNQTSDVVIGGLAKSEANEIGETGNAVHVSDVPSGAVSISRNTINDNRIGVLLEQAPEVYIANNVIRANSGEGIKLDGTKTRGVRIERNSVTDNGGDGICLGIDVQGAILSYNTVARNGGYGIKFEAGENKNVILGGSIFDNSSGGIKSDDPPPPKVSHVGRTSIVGEVPQSISEGSLIQVYADAKDQGRRFLGQTRVHGKGWRLKVVPPQGTNIAATVTEPDNGTSAFGQVGQPVRKPSFYGNQALVFTSTRKGSRQIYIHLPGSSNDIWIPVFIPMVPIPPEEYSPHSPALSPNGRMIAFVLEINDNPDIWVMNSDGMNAFQLTFHQAADYDPSWSADGRRIAFVSERDGNPEIYSISVDPFNPDLKRLTDNPGVDRHPDWSSKGRIAFTSDRSGNKEIWVMDTDGGNKIRLTNSDSSEYDPAWSPDGNRIAFVGEKDGNPEIYLMDENGANVVRLTNNPSADVQPTWSPNGMWVGFASGRLGDMEIFAKEVSGSRLERITVSLGINMEPSWGSGVVVPPWMAVK